MACSGLDGNLVDDPTPQLGEDLDTNAHDIKFYDVKGILDDSGNEQLIFGKTASAVNYLKITNSATTNCPSISALGDDTYIGIDLLPKLVGL